MCVCLYVSAGVFCAWSSISVSVFVNGVAETVTRPLQLFTRSGSRVFQRGGQNILEVSYKLRLYVTL